MVGRPTVPIPLVIADADTDAYLGAVVLRLDEPRRIAQLGYAVHPRARGLICWPLLPGDDTTPAPGG